MSHIWGMVAWLSNADIAKVNYLHKWEYGWGGLWTCDLKIGRQANGWLDTSKYGENSYVDE